MRIAVISDIHGHHVALKAVLSDIAKQNIHQTICLGDVASLGPQPREVLQTLHDLEIPTTMGNHDTALLGIGSLADNRIPAFLTDAMSWGRQQLTKNDLSYMKTFQETYTIEFDGRSYALCFHATPTSRTEQLLATTPQQTVDEMFASYQQEQIFIGGHTHVQMIRKHGAKTIVNPGSVGNVFLHAQTNGATSPTILPWAEYAILHIEPDGVSIELKKVHFERQLSVDILRESKLPIKEHWIQAYSTKAEPWLATF